MKILSRIALLLLLMFALVACSEDEETDANVEEEDTTQNEETPAEEPEDTEEPAEEPEDTEEPAEEPDTSVGSDNSELLSLMSEALAGVTSQSSDVSMLMEMTSADASQNGRIEFSFATDQVMSSGESYTKGYMATDMGGESFSMDLEAYVTEEGSYSFNSMLGGWMADPSGASAQLAGLTPEQSLTQLQSFEGLIVEEIDGAIVVSVDAEAIESMSSLLSNVMPTQQTGIDPNADFSIAVDMFQYTVNPDTYLLEDVTYDFTMTGNDPELGEVSVRVLLNMVMTGYNDIDDIVVPQDIVDSATSM